MEFWDSTIHTALLGTDKKRLTKEELPSGLAAVYEVTNAEDKEEQYLQVASVALNYRRCGAVPLHQTVAGTVAGEETRQYAGTAAHQLLNDVLSSESYALTELWLQQCRTKNYIVLPELIPHLFNLAMKQKTLQPLITDVAGKRGVWLLSLNENWKFEKGETDEPVWQTGTTEDRKQYLRKIRREEPAKGRELLQQTWPQENANTKAELLKPLSVGIGEEDLSWLESLLNDKSQKIRDEVIKLLKLLPQSSVVQNYWNIITQSIRIKKERGLLGIGSKTSLEIALPNSIDETIFKTGIEKVATQKGADDNDFILHQLISAVPPSFFEQHYGLSKHDLLHLFLQSKRGKPFISAWGAGAMLFKEADWAKAVIAITENDFYADAFRLLNKEEREAYALRFLQKNEHEHPAIEQLKKYGGGEWGVELTKAIFKYTAKNGYHFSQAFYKGIILFIPIDIIPQLEKCTPQNEWARDSWSKMSEYIIQLLTLRIQIIQAFQS